MLLAFQAVLLGVFWSMKEHGPMGANDRDGETIAFEVVDRPVPSLMVSSKEGDQQLHAAGRPALLHFWATWCAPCRAELPALLAFQAELPGVDVVTISVDESWEVIDHFFDGDAPSTVRRIDHALARQRLSVDALPVTLFVAADGRVVARSNGAQAWTKTQAAAVLDRLNGARGLP